VVGSCEHGDEPLSSSTIELVSFAVTVLFSFSSYAEVCIHLTQGFVVCRIMFLMVLRIYTDVIPISRNALLLLYSL
jgi:hypothetical protein